VLFSTVLISGANWRKNRVGKSSGGFLYPVGTAVCPRGEESSHPSEFGLTGSRCDNYEAACRLGHEKNKEEDKRCPELSQCSTSPPELQGFLWGSPCPRIHTQAEAALASDQGMLERKTWKFTISSVILQVVFLSDLSATHSFLEPPKATPCILP
jgi:hypothetical protein